MVEIKEGPNKWKTSSVHGLESLILLRWQHFPNSPTDSMQSLSKFHLPSTYKFTVQYSPSVVSDFATPWIGHDWATEPNWTESLQSHKLIPERVKACGAKVSLILNLIGAPLGKTLGVLIWGILIGQGKGRGVPWAKEDGETEEMRAWEGGSVAVERGGPWGGVAPNLLGASQE